MPLIRYDAAAEFETKNMQLRIILLALLLASCGLKPYKMDIQQGNFITAEMRAQLKLGMSKTQVRYVLGTPLVNDPFHDNRWDYIYRLEHGGKITEQQRLTLHFSGNSLQSIDDGTRVVQADPVAAKVMPTISPAIVPAPDIPKVAAAKPDRETPLADPSTDVKDAVQAWAEAWSAKDLDQYFASYADTFKPVGLSKMAWRNQRKQRIDKPNEIVVTLADLKIKLGDDTHASATFTQDYRADAYRDTSRKILQLEKIDGTWLIVSEQTTK
jgi:outer membrane protein assembly factor BamE